jgi:hypothetical protein
MGTGLRGEFREYGKRASTTIPHWKGVDGERWWGSDVQRWSPIGGGDEV